MTYSTTIRQHPDGMVHGGGAPIVVVVVGGVVVVVVGGAVVVVVAGTVVVVVGGIVVVVVQRKIGLLPNVRLTVSPLRIVIQ